MSKNLLRALPKLEFVNEIKDKKLQMQVLKYFARNKFFYKALKEISKNVIKGNVKLSNYKKRKIAQYRKNLYAIAYDQRSNPKRRQREAGLIGGWLWIIPTIAQLLR